MPDADRRPDATLRAAGSVADDSARLGSLLGECWGNGSLVRSSLSLTPFAADGGFRFWLIDPSFSSVWNARLPRSFNDGAMWAGRGLNLEVSAGVSAQYRRARVVFAPKFVTSQNLPYPIIPSGDPTKSDFASPWHAGPLFADMPSRFGNVRYTRIDPGESAAELVLSHLAVGITSTTEWWGPGLRNALVLSNNAAGVPRMEVRTRSPWPTRLGDVEARWMLGALTESPFFDQDGSNNLRSLSAAAVTLRLSADSGLTVGAARTVYASVTSLTEMAGHFADVLVDWNRPPLEGETDRGSDQVLSLFGRWVFPVAGIAAHVEWAKVRPPKSLREFLVNPHDGQGYTLGIEWAHDAGATTTVRVEGEVTTLEQTPETTGGLVPDFYVSHAVVHGYTNEGQVLGAAIGPGSSSQFIGASLLHANWRVEGNLGRIRWEEGAYYRPPSQGRFAWRAHDVSVFGGLSAGADWPWAQASVSLVRTLRMNYLFQTPNAFLPDNTTFDMRNTTIGLRIVPHLRLRHPSRGG